MILSTPCAKGFPGGTVRAVGYHRAGEQFRIVTDVPLLQGDTLAESGGEDTHGPGIGQRNVAGPVSWMMTPEPAKSPAPMAVMVR